MFGIIGPKAKYPGLSWWENFMGGHITIGPITIYGANAMNWAVNIKSKWGYICFSLPSIRRYKYGRKPYFYISPDATPGSSTYYRGPRKEERIKSKYRRAMLGHNFNRNIPEVEELFQWIKDAKIIQ